MPTRRDLRSTLTLWFASISTFELVVLATVFLLAGRGFYRARAEDALAAQAGAALVGLLAAAELPDTEEELRASLPQDGHAVYAALFRERDGLRASWGVRTPGALAHPTAADGPLSLAFAPLTEDEARALTGQGARLVRVTAPFRRGGELCFLELGLPAQDWTATLLALAALLAGSALVLALIARLAARRIAARTLSPFSGLAAAVRELSPDQPGGRLPAHSADVELRRLEEELNGALERLEEAFRDQAHFAGHVAHELRTPIAALMAEAQVSRLGARTLEKGYAFLDLAEEELRHLSELVESFLFMAQVDAHPPRHDLVYLDDVVRRALARCSAMAAKAGVELASHLAGATPAGDPFVRGDAQLLQAMLENLMRNAVRHSPRGESVTVETACVGDAVQVSVSDRGPGIPEEFRQALFQRGSRLPARRAPGGAGLGLAIVGSVVNLHGGRVSVESVSGGGCSFVVVLPAAAPVACER